MAERIKPNIYPGISIKSIPSVSFYLASRAIRAEARCFSISTPSLRPAFVRRSTGRSISHENAPRTKLHVSFGVQLKVERYYGAARKYVQLPLPHLAAIWPALSEIGILGNTFSPPPPLTLVSTSSEETLHSVPAYAYSRRFSYPRVCFIFTGLFPSRYSVQRRKESEKPVPLAGQRID